MIPAHERFEASDRAILKPDDGLIEKRDLPALNGAPQLRFERNAVGFARAHRRLEYLDAVAADALGVVHGKFGILKKLVLALGLMVDEREPNRRGKQNFAIIEGDRRAQRLGDRVGECRNAL